MPLETANFAPQALNALERLEAARGWTSTSDVGWLWTVLLLAVLLAAVTALCAALYRRWRLDKHNKQVFQRRCDQAGLTDRQRQGMLAIAKAARLRDLEPLFTSEAAFDRAVARLKRSRRITSMRQERRRSIDELIELLRQKLHFEGLVDRPEEGAPASRQDTVHFAAGDRLMVAFRGKAVPFDVSVAEAGPDELVVQAGAPLDCRPGESWLMRYSKGGGLWEFEASVLEDRDGTIRLERVGTARFINRRRFPRVETRRPAQVARFPFETSDLGLTSENLVPGELVEIGGTGLRLQAPVDVRDGERVLVALEFADGAVEAVGRVRRADPGEPEGSTMVVELMGLTEEEIAKLAHETNVAAQENARRAEAAGEAPPWRGAPDHAEPQDVQED